MPRLDWPEYHTAIAETVSLRASCPRAAVGVVIVKDNRILATGYNGAPSGQSDCLTVGCLMVDGHCQRSIHAEVNAVGYAARYGVSLDGATLFMFMTDMRGPAPRRMRNPEPCRECRKVLIGAGVTCYGDLGRREGSGVWGAPASLWTPAGGLHAGVEVDGSVSRNATAGYAQGARYPADDDSHQDGAAHGDAESPRLGGGYRGVRTGLRADGGNRPVDPLGAVCRKCLRPLREHEPFALPSEWGSCESFTL